MIGQSGGSATLEGYATITFPQGSLGGNTNVVVQATSTAETATDWSVTSPIFSANVRAPYEVRVNVGNVQPSMDVSCTFALRPEFLASLVSNSEVQVFAQIYDNGGKANAAGIYSLLDSFELFPSVVDLSKKTVSVTLPRSMFTNARTSDGTFEAVIVVGATPTKPSTSVSSKNATGQSPSLPRSPPPLQGFSGVQDTPNYKTFVLPGKQAIPAAAGQCDGASLGPALEGANEVTSGFDPSASHYGTDYLATTGSRVNAMADGVIEKVGFDERPLPRPDPRSGKLVKGWGRYVVVRHTDGSKTLYAHLESDGVAVSAGQSVSKGQQIANSDNSGGSSGPHLHVEYAPNGQIYDKASKVDPNACVGSTLSSGITVGDNGSAADDAFAVAVDSLTVCQTSIGATNSCAIGSLRPGTHVLTLTCTIAPDDIGTFEIILDSGLTFSDGSTTVSGVLAQGESQTFSINKS